MNALDLAAASVSGVILASQAGAYILLEEDRRRVKRAAARVREASARNVKASAADLADARRYFGHLQAVAAHNLMMCFGRSRDEMTSGRINRQAAQAYKRAGYASPRSAADWLNAIEHLIHEQSKALEESW